MPMDLEFFMPPEKIPQALKALDVDGDGKISLADMRDAVIQVLAPPACRPVLPCLPPFSCHFCSAMCVLLYLSCYVFSAMCVLLGVSCHICPAMFVLLCLAC